METGYEILLCIEKGYQKSTHCNACLLSKRFCFDLVVCFRGKIVTLHGYMYLMLYV